MNERVEVLTSDLRVLIAYLNELDRTLNTWSQTRDFFVLWLPDNDNFEGTTQDT